MLLPAQTTHLSSLSGSTLCPYDSWPRALLQSLLGCILLCASTVVNPSVPAIVTYLPCGFLVLWSLPGRCHLDYRPLIFTDHPGSHRDVGTTRYSTPDPVDLSTSSLLVWDYSTTMAKPRSLSPAWVELLRDPETNRTSRARSTHLSAHDVRLQRSSPDRPDVCVTYL